MKKCVENCKGCFGNNAGECEVLSEVIKKCPFKKTVEQAKKDLEKYPLRADAKKEEILPKSLL